MSRYPGCMTPRTGAERYFDRRLEDIEYREGYERARERIAQFDEVIRALDERRVKLDLSKAELARRAEMPPDAVRRLFASGPSNPTLRTLTAIAEALGLKIAAIHRAAASSGSSVTRARSADARTRRRTA